MQTANISNMDYIQNLFQETIVEFMGNDLEAELSEELGYSKYDYKNKDTENSRNSRSSKHLRTSFGDIEVSVSRDLKGEFEPQVLKIIRRYRSEYRRKILSMYAKGMTLSDVEEHIRDIYSLNVADTTIAGQQIKPRQLQRIGSRDLTCTDDLVGFPVAIKTVFMKTEI